jgi:hypothetical protein
MSLDGSELLPTMVAVSFAAGLNVYATMATLGLLARFGVLALPPPIVFLSNEWVIGVSLVLFLIEFVADKIPLFDLVWNALQTFIRIPAGAFLAWSSAASLSPAGQVTVALAGAAIALAAHGGKLAMRSAVTASPEPVSNIVLSLVEDLVAIGLTWFAAEYPLLAASLALVLLATIVLVIRWVWRALRASLRGARRKPA